MIINTVYDLFLQSVSWYLQLQMTTTETSFQFHRWRTESEPSICRTWTQTWFFKSTHNLNRAEPLLSKNLNEHQAKILGSFPSLVISAVCCWRMEEHVVILTCFTRPEEHTFVKLQCAIHIYNICICVSSSSPVVIHLQQRGTAMSVLWHIEAHILAKNWKVLSQMLMLFYLFIFTSLFHSSLYKPF